MSATDQTAGALEPEPLGVLAAIAANAGRDPARGAVSDARRELSYGQLIEEVEGTAAGLAALGVREGSRVALALGNGVEFVVAALACMRASAVFTPVAVSDPAPRRAAVLTDFDPAVVVTDGGRHPGVRGVPVVSVRDLAADRAHRRRLHGPRAEPGEVSGCETDGRSVPDARIAYCVYTSGTTGSPKGVMVSRTALAWAVSEIGRIVGVDRSTRALCVSPVHFDGSFSVIFPTLYYGGHLVIPDRERLRFPRAYFAALARHRINCVSFSPSFLRLLEAGGGVGPLADTDVSVLALGGEAPTCDEVRRIWAANPRIRVINRYGPTETAISVSDLELTPEMLDGGYVPIGSPHLGTGFHLISATGETVGASGVMAELCVSGRQLMSGYWRAPELTAAALRDDLVGGRLVYRTGDLVSLDERGLLEFAGRADRLVKHRGVRVSLVELAEQVSRIDGVRAATAIAFDDQGSLGIAAFVVAAPGTSAPLIQASLHDLLPPVMHPDRLWLVPALPLGRSSKVDESRLLAEAGLRAWAPSG